MNENPSFQTFGD